MLHTAANPICVITRPDGELTSLFHSFFLLKVGGEGLMEVLWRVPERRARIDDIESGLGIFINDIIALNSSAPDMFGTFVITTSDGSRFFAAWRGTGDHIFVAVSKSPIGSFSRELFYLLQSELHQNIPQILLNFCETPVLPVANCEYVFRLSSGCTTLRFSKVEQVEDIDVSLTGLTLLSPSMMVSAWEAILMERKLLVVSTNSVIIPACCEFLRRTVLPLSVINTYVPLLPEQLMGTIEAPFPYVLGANSNLLRASDIDTSETLILDLDSRSIVQPEKKENIVEAPKELRERLLRTLNDILLGSLTRWIQRAVPGGDEMRVSGGSATVDAISDTCNPLSAASVHSRATEVFNLFMQTNLSLLTARRCNITGFFRNPVKVTQRASNNGHMYKNGVTCGCMQMLSTRSSGNTQLIPCWFEMDAHCILVYQFADEIPLLSIFFRNVKSVSPSHMEPDGHVFDINVKPEKHYGFAAIDMETRSKWICEISRMILYYRSTHGTSRGNGSMVHSTSADVSLGDLVSLAESEKTNLPESQLGEFRANLLQTQMVSYLKSKLEFEEYELVLNEIGLGSISMTECNGPPVLTVEPPTRFQSKLSPHSADKDEMAICSLVENWAAYVSEENEIDIEAEVDSIRDTIVINQSSPHSESRRSGYKKSFKSFFKRVSGSTVEEDIDEKRDSAGSQERAISADELTLSSSKTGNLERNTIINEAIKAQAKKDKAMIEAKTNAMQALRSEIDDQHRLLEDELKTVIIEERTWRLKLLLGDKGALDDDKVTARRVSGSGRPSRSSRDSIIEKSLTGAAFPEAEPRPAPKGAHDFVERLRVYSNQKEDRVQISGKLSITLTVYSLDDDLDCDDIAVDASFSSATVKSVEEGVWLKGVIEGVEDEGSVDRSVDNSESEMTDVSMAGSQDHSSWKSTLNRWAKLGFKKSNKSESTRRRLNVTNSLHAYRKRMLNELKEQTEECHFEEGAYPLYSVLRTMMGYVYEQAMNYEQAVFAYSEGALMSQRRLMRNLVQKFANCDFPSKLGQNSIGVNKKPAECATVCNAEYLETFLIWATGCGDIVKIQAFQFISELLHRRLSRLSGENMDARGIMSRRTMSTTGITALGSSSTAEHMVRAFSKPSTGRGSSSGRNGNLELARPDVLNEMYLCSEQTTDPCGLTVMLMQRLLEIIRSVCKKEFNRDEDQRTYESASADQKFSILRVRLREPVRNAVMASAEFRLFEMMTCELQKVDVSGLDDDHKTLFFVNLFNIITVHYIIASGPSSPSLFDRYLFMRSSKYNIGGLVLNLMDIEHNVLRGQNSHAVPAVFKKLSFSDRDIRTRLRIKNARPHLSFVLFSGTLSSPALTVLQNVSTLDADIEQAAAVYLSNSVRCDSITRTLHLPELIQFYWKDFGGSYHNVCALIAKNGSTSVQADLKALLAAAAHPKVTFTPYDWNAYIVLLSNV